MKKLLNRIDDSRSPFKTIEDAKEWEALAGPNGITASQLRSMPADELKELARRMAVLLEKYPNWARMQTLVDVSDDTVLNNMLVEEVGWGSDVWINFAEKYGVNLKPDVLTAIFLNLPKNKQNQFLGQLSKEKQKQIINQLPDQADYNQLKPVPERTEPTDDTDTITDDDPEPEPEPTPIPTPIQIPRKATPEDDPDPTPPPEDTPEPTPPIILSKEEQEKRREMNIQLYNGAKTDWRVTYHYPKGKTETVNVEARSLPEAIAKAQRKKRPNMNHPRLTDIVRA